MVNSNSDTCPVHTNSILPSGSPSHLPPALPAAPLDILSANIRLRRFSPKDVPALYRVLSDPEVMQYIEPPFSLTQTETFLREYGLKEPPLVYALALSDSDTVIGHAIFHPYDASSYEIGWIIGRAHWNLGIASAVTLLLLSHAKMLGIAQLVLECSPKQHATIHIAQKFGFSPTEPAKELLVFRKNL